MTENLERQALIPVKPEGSPFGFAAGQERIGHGESATGPVEFLDAVRPQIKDLRRPDPGSRPIATDARYRRIGCVRVKLVDHLRKSIICGACDSKQRWTVVL